MFKVRNKKTNEIVTVLSVYCEPTFGSSYFFVWEHGGWRWRPASGYVPPNWEEEK